MTIDRALRDSIRADAHRFGKRVLRKHDYPPDKQELAHQTVLERSEIPQGELSSVIRSRRYRKERIPVYRCVKIQSNASMLVGKGSTAPDLQTLHRRHREV